MSLLEKLLATIVFAPDGVGGGAVAVADPEEFDDADEGDEDPEGFDGDDVEETNESDEDDPETGGEESDEDEGDPETNDVTPDHVAATPAYDTQVESGISSIEREMAEIDSFAGELVKVLQQQDPQTAESDADYDRILADQASAQGQLKALEHQHSQMQRRLAQIRAESWHRQTDAGRKKHKDFDRVMSSPTFQPEKHVADVISRMSGGADIAYRLAKTPGVLAKINALSPMAAAIELGRMTGGGGKRVAKKVSRAPAPPKRVKGRGDKGGKEKVGFRSMEKMLGYE